MGKFKTYNGPSPTTAGQLAVSTGTTVKTMQQLKAGATKGLIISGWQFSLDTPQAAAGEIELVSTDAIAATVTAAVAGDIVALATPSAATTVALGTAATGYTASAEGSITTCHVFDVVRLTVSTTGQLTYSYNFPANQQPYLPPGKVLRVRSTTGTSAGMICAISWVE